MKKINDDQIKTILDDKFDKNFWIFQLGINSDEPSVYKDNEFSFDLYEKGLKKWEEYRYKIYELICDRNNKVPQDWVNELISGELRNFITALAAILISKYNLEMSLVIPLIALVLKNNISTFCKEY